MGVYVTTFGTGKVEDHKSPKAVSSLFDFSPRALIAHVELLPQQYVPTAAYDLFGRAEKSFTWERTNRADETADALLGKPGKGTTVDKAAKSKEATPKAKYKKKK